MHPNVALLLNPGGEFRPQDPCATLHHLYSNPRCAYACYKSVAMCLSAYVCLSVCEHISGTVYTSDLHQISVHIAHGRAVRLSSAGVAIGYVLPVYG